MTHAQLHPAFRTGVIFGVVVIFLMLIGFATTAAQLLGALLGNMTFPLVNLLFLLGLVGLWGGAMGVRSAEAAISAPQAAPAAKTDTANAALVCGLMTGGMTGLLVAGLVFVVSILHARGANIRACLYALSPETIQLLSLGLPPAAAALAHLGLQLLSGIAGALLGRAVSLRGDHWQRRLSASRQLVRRRLASSASQPKIAHVWANRRLRRPLLCCSGLALVLLLPLVLGQYWNYNLGTIGIYVVLGLGLNVVVGLAGLLDLGYVAFFAIGAYTMALLTAPEPHHLQWSFWIALPIAVCLAALTGVLLGIPVLRLRGDYLAIVTLGFGEIIGILSRSDMLAPFSGGPLGVRGIAGPTLLGRTFSSQRDFLYLIVLSVLLTIFVTSRLRNSRVGRAWLAMADDETVSRAMGLNTLKYKLLAFGIGAAFAGLGGALFAARNQFTGPEDQTLMVSINVLALIIVGGTGSVPGIIIGALVLKGLPEMLRPLENYRLLAFGALLVVMIIWKPTGLWPPAKRRLESREVAEAFSDAEITTTEDKLKQ